MMQPEQNHSIVREGKILKMARLVGEWAVDIKDPDALISYVKAKKYADVLTFWQRMGDDRPKFKYYSEDEYIAALSLSTYEDWFTKTINAKTRNMIRKSEREGLIVEKTPYGKDLIEGITKIFNETPIRQGRPFLHYGKSPSQVDSEMSHALDKSIFIGAFYEGELYGFIKLLFVPNYVMIVEILSMIKHRDKAPNNALVSKAVEICTDMNIRNVVYASWVEGPLGEFKRKNGFAPVKCARYYVPISLKGKVALLLNIHKGMKNVLPESLVTYLKNIRTSVYKKIYKHK